MKLIILNEKKYILHMSFMSHLCHALGSIIIESIEVK